MDLEPVAAEQFRQFAAMFAVSVAMPIKAWRRFDIFDFSAEISELSQNLRRIVQ